MGPCDQLSPQDEEEDLEFLFEKAFDDVMTRSQPAVGLAAGSGSDQGVPGPEVGAEAPHPVMMHRLESAKPAKKHRGSAELQGLGSSTALTTQQLNSKKQNARRAKEKAAEKSSQAHSTLLFKKGRAAEPHHQEGRILETVADFWAKKKARVAARGDG